MVRGVYLSHAGSERMTVEAALDRYLAEVTPTKKATTQRSEGVTAKHLTSILGKYSMAAVTCDLAASYRDHRIADGNPITRFDLDGLDELGAEEAWTILRMPQGLTEGIQFREIANEELAEAYHRMEEWGRENSCLQNPSLVNA